MQVIMAGERMGVNAIARFTEKTSISPDSSVVETILAKPYANYPILDIQHGSCRIIVEGYIYHKNYTAEIIASEIGQTIKSASSEVLPALRKLAEKFSRLPGEFACWVITENHLFFFNEVLGRLPVYFLQSSRLVFIGRSLAGLFAASPRQPDEDGIFETLWCGYALGRHTLYKDVQRIPGGCFMTVDLVNFTLKEDQLSTIELDSRNENWSGKDAVELAQSFNDVCQQISTASPLPFHVSLSGGQDSRAVLAAMKRANPNITASSFAFSSSDHDVVVAEKVASLLGVPWEKIGINNSNEDDEWLLHLKQGINYKGMAFIGDYLRKVADQFPLGAIMLTGDGGDKVLPYLGERHNPSGLNHLVELLFNRHAIAEPKLVAALMGKKEDDLKQLIYETVSSYPEHHMNNRSIRFTLFERGGKAYFEGEDRNRYFMWSTTPFYHLDFLQRAMLVPDNMKRNYRAYALFMQHLNKALSQIPDAGGGKLSSPVFHFRKYVQEYFRSSPPVVKNQVKLLYRLLRGGGSHVPITKFDAVPGSLTFIKTSALAEYTRRTSADSQLYLETIIKVFAP